MAFSGLVMSFRSLWSFWSFWSFFYRIASIGDSRAARMAG